MEIVGSGIVFSGEKGTDRQSCAFSGICVLPGGRWLCTFRAAPAKKDVWPETALVTWSDDLGKTWSKPIQPWKERDVDGKTGSMHCAYVTSLGGGKVLAAVCWVDHSNPQLPFFNEETEGLLDTRVFLSESDDGGETWSEPRLVDTTPFNIPTAITGPVLVLPNGDWGCQFELNKHYYDTSVWRHSSVIMFSKDEGKSWPEHVIAANDPENRIFYWDQRPNVLADGTVLDIFWTYDNKAAVYLNIHARKSVDNGRNWSEMWDTGVPGQPAAPVSLPDGKIAMVYVDRTGPPFIKMRISADGGKSWPDSNEIIIYRTEEKSQTLKKSSMQDAWAEMGKYSVGLPATTLTSEGNVVVVYYAGPETDRTDICWARIKS